MKLYTCTLTLRKEYVNKPFGVVSRKVNEKTKHDLWATFPDRKHKRSFLYLKENAKLQSQAIIICCALEKQVAAWFGDDDLIIATRELHNHRNVFLWGKGRNKEAGCRWWMLGMRSYWRMEKIQETEKRGDTEPTLLFSGCTPRICKEGGACLPGQQKE